MSIFGDPASTKILKEIKDLKKDLAALKGEYEGIKENVNFEQERATLKQKLTDLQIEYDREREKWDRERRDVEHQVGLQRKRGEFETESATRTAKLEVREENLAADKARFDEHVRFIEERFEQQFASLNELMGKFLERMPTTEQLIRVGGNGNGGDDDAA
jgi:hypothetical protein